MAGGGAYRWKESKGMWVLETGAEIVDCMLLGYSLSKDVQADRKPMQFYWNLISAALGISTWHGTCWGVNVLLYTTDTEYSEWIINWSIVKDYAPCLSKSVRVWPVLSTGTRPPSTSHSRVCSHPLGFALACIWLHHIIKIILFTLEVHVFFSKIWHAV